MLILMLLAMPVAAQTDTPTATFVPTATYRPPGTSPRGSRDCGFGLPCGPIPWNLPRYPILESPTPMPTLFSSATPTSTMTPTLTPVPTNFTPSPTASATMTPSRTPTLTATFTATALFDTQELADNIATVRALIDSTPISVEVAGTPVTVADQISTAAPGIEDLFGRAKGIIGADWGPFTPLFQTAFMGIAIFLFIIILTYTIPIIGFVFGMIRKIYTAITDLIPL